MSAVTLTPSATVHEAHAALHMAMDLPGRATVAPAIIALADALETYEAIDSDALHWESVFPHLRDEADPDESALTMALADVEAAAETLVGALAASGVTA